MMTKTVEQISRAYEMLDFIEAHPDAHDQNWWINHDKRITRAGLDAARALNTCGTTACAAGWTVLLAGGRFVSTWRVQLPDGGSWRVEDAAAFLLGMGDSEAAALFRRARDLAEVRKAVFDIFGPRPGTF